MVKKGHTEPPAASHKIKKVGIIMENMDKNQYYQENQGYQGKNQDPVENLIIKNRIPRDILFLKVCLLVSQRSTCLRSQVGAVVVRDGRIVSMGYNGPISGTPPCIQPNLLLDDLDLENPYFSTPCGKEYRARRCLGAGCTRSLHAETNAIAFAARAGVSVEGCILYCTMSPCINCAKVIVNSGIKEFKYLEDYRDSSGLELLRKAGITVEHLDAIYMGAMK